MHEPADRGRNPIRRFVVHGIVEPLVDDIVELTGWTPMLVQTALGRAGLVPPRRGRRWPYDAATEAAIAAAYDAGATIAELVAAHGGSNRAVRLVLEHRGLAVRPQGRPALAA